MSTAANYHYTAKVIENNQLRAQIEKHISVYRESLYLIVEMKTKLQLIDMAMHGGDGAI